MNPTATRYTLAPLAYPPRTKTERKQILQPILRQLLTKLGFKTGKRPEYDAHGNLKGNHAAWVRNVPSGRQYLTLDYEAYPGSAIFLNAYIVVTEATRLEQEILAIRQDGYVALTHEQTWLKLSHSQLCLSESEYSGNDQLYLQSLLDSVTEEALPLLDTLSTHEGLNRIINGEYRGKYALPEDFLGRLSISVLSGPPELDIQANLIPQLIERYTETSNRWTRMPERYLYWHVDALSDWPRILEIARSFKPGTAKPDNASPPAELQESPEQQWIKLLAALPFPPYMHLQDIDEDLWTYVSPPGFWPDDIRRDIRDMPLSHAKAWSALWAHCMEAKGATPGKTWLKKAAQILAPLQGDHSPVMARWLDWMTNHSHQVICPYWCGDKIHEAVVLGFVWCASLGEPSMVAAPLARFATYCHGWGWLHKVDLRRRSEKIKGAAIWSLAQLGNHGFTAIGGLESQGINDYKYGELDKITDSSRWRWMEGGLSDAPFNPAGLWETRCGTELTLRFDTEYGCSRIFNDTGKPLGKIPKQVKDQYAARLKHWEDLVNPAKCRPGLIKDILAEALVHQRRMSGAYWLDRYGGSVQCLTGQGRKMIWRVEQQGAFQDIFWHDDAWRDMDGGLMAPLCPDAVIRLWHPAQATPEEVQRWRNFLDMHGIVQPVAQAWRAAFRVPAEETQATGCTLFKDLPLPVPHAKWRILSIIHWQTADSQAPVYPYPLVDPFCPLDRNGLKAELSVSGNTAGMLRFQRNGVDFPLGEVPPSLFSEAVRDLDEAFLPSLLALRPWVSGVSPCGHLNLRLEALTRMIDQIPGLFSRVRLEHGTLRVRGDLHVYLLDTVTCAVTIEGEDHPLRLRYSPHQELSLPGASHALQIWYPDLKGVRQPFDDEPNRNLLSLALYLVNDARMEGKDREQIER